MKARPAKKKGRVLLELDRTDESMLPTGGPFKIQRILVPVDFSETSHKAVRYAVAFAAHYNARLTLLHVIEPFTLPAELSYVPPEVEEAAQSAMKNALEKLAGVCRDQLGTQCLSQATVRMGIPWQEITGAARETGADMIIISTHGRTGLRHVVLGSSAERVVRHAPCPVLVVREEEHDFVMG